MRLRRRGPAPPAGGGRRWCTRPSPTGARRWPARWRWRRTRRRASAIAPARPWSSSATRPTRAPSACRPADYPRLAELLGSWHVITEHAPAKVNLVLQVGRRRDDGLHELCSLFAPLELADELAFESAERDEVVAPGVEGPNLVQAALDAFRTRAALEPLRVEIEKRIPVAGGLGGGSADAAAALRAANRLAGEPLGPATSCGASAPRIGADVPSQVDPAPSLVTGRGRGGRADRARRRCGWCWCRAPRGCRRRRCTPSSTGCGGRPGSARPRARCGPWPAPTRRGSRRSAENDLEAAALSLRPELERDARPPRRQRRAGRAAERLRADGLRDLRRPSRPRSGGRCRDPRRRWSPAPGRRPSSQ